MKSLMTRLTPSRRVSVCHPASKVALVHRAGDVDRQDEIARGDLARHGIADPLRPRQRRDDRIQIRLATIICTRAAAARRRLAAGSARGRRQPIEERHLHRRLPRAIWRQHHHASIGSGSSRSIHGQANSNMVPLIQRSTRRAAIELVAPARR
jgi:hypothetical protein